MPRIYIGDYSNVLYLDNGETQGVKACSCANGCEHHVKSSHVCLSDIARRGTVGVVECEHHSLSGRATNQWSFNGICIKCNPDTIQEVICMFNGGEIASVV
jgi:hypothetical protein